jgi:hypothetical protein
MYDSASAAQLAARVRSLIGGRDRRLVNRAAATLDVHAGDLWEIVEHATPYPSVPVLAALVAGYGVDAAWLVTGGYDPSAHRAAEELDEAPRIVVARLLRDATRP